MNRQRTYQMITKRECVKKSKRQLQETWTRLEILMENKTYTVLCTYYLKREHLRTEDLSTASRLKDSTDVSPWDVIVFPMLDVRQTFAVVFSCNLDKRQLVVCVHVLILLRETWIEKKNNKKLWRKNPECFTLTPKASSFFTLFESPLKLHQGRIIDLVIGCTYGISRQWRELSSHLMCTFFPLYKCAQM